MTIDGAWIEGPWRRPHQLLAAQRVGRAGSIHDQATATRLGYTAGAIEGPTHFGQFVPLCAQAWGQDWFQTGSLSARFSRPAYAGEEVRAALQGPVDGAGPQAIRLAKRDGTEVLRGTASIGPGHPPSQLRHSAERAGRRSHAAAAPDWAVGNRSGRIRACLSFDEPLGDLYPFSLAEKLVVMTEPHPWYMPGQGHQSPWGRPILPLEMISVLVRHNSGNFPFPADYPHVQLFAGLEISLRAGPLFVDQAYDVEHAVLAATQASGKDSVWIETTVFANGSESPLATMLLNIIGLGA